MTGERLAGASDDRVLPFQVEGLDVRGRVVRLGPAVDAVIARHRYPPEVSKVLGEAVALTVLLGSSLRIDGRFQLQTRTDGPVAMLVVDFEAPDRLRAYAQYDAARIAELDVAPPALSGAVLGHGHLALTAEPSAGRARYQGVVALEGRGLEEAAHEYFRQSEQIPTRVRLAVAEAMRGGADPSWRAGGILVQFLPPAGERVRDLPPGDAPEGIEPPARPEEDDAWVEARALVDTVEDHELIDPTVSSEELLVRLFHERGVRVFQPREIHEACHCSRPRIVSMLKSFSPEERHDMVGEDGVITVTCEFCSTVYTVDPAEIEDGTGEA